MVKQHAPSRVVKALHQADDGALAPATGAHKGDLLPRGYMKAQVLQHMCAGAGRVSKPVDQWDVANTATTLLSMAARGRVKAKVYA